jgi:hypothetical protein
MSPLSPLPSIHHIAVGVLQPVFHLLISYCCYQALHLLMVPHGIQGALLCSVCYWDILFLLLLVDTEQLLLSGVTVLQ